MTHVHTEIIESEEDPCYFITIAGAKHRVDTEYSDELCSEIGSLFVLEPTDVWLGLESGGVRKPLPHSKFGNHYFDEVEPWDDVEFNSFEPGVPKMCKFCHGDGGYTYLEKEYEVETYVPPNMIEITMSFSCFGVQDDCIVHDDQEAIHKIIDTAAKEIMEARGLNFDLQPCSGDVNSYYQMPTIKFLIPEFTREEDTVEMLRSGGTALEAFVDDMETIQETIQEVSYEFAEAAGAWWTEPYEEEEEETV